MASTRIGRRKDGTTYTQVLWRAEGKQRSQSFDDPTLAEKFRVLLEVHGPEAARRTIGIEEDFRNEMLLSEWLTLHIDTLTGIQPATRNRYRSYAANDLAEMGKLPLSAITEMTVKRWVAAMEAAKVSAKTIKNKHGFLAGALNAAIPTHLTVNPCDKTRLPRSDGDEMVFLTRPEFDMIHAEMTDRWKPLFLWLVTTGTRFSEATALTVGDINDEAMTCRVNKAWKYSESMATRELGLTKSRKGQRTINLAEKTIEVLDLSRPKNELLFPTESGGAISSQLATNKGWKPAREKAAKKGLDKVPRIHDLRHTCASWMIQAGVSLPVVQAHLGHESINTTISVYNHLDRTSMHQAARVIDQMFSESEDS